MLRNATVGDKAIFYGTVLSFILTAAGFTAWLTRIDYTASTTAQAQEIFHDKVDARLENIDIRLAHIEGHLEGIEKAVKQ
jgi:hypothetical protein